MTNRPSTRAAIPAPGGLRPGSEVLLRMVEHLRSAAVGEPLIQRTLAAQEGARTGRAVALAEGGRATRVGRALAVWRWVELRQEELAGATRVVQGPVENSVKSRDSLATSLPSIPSIRTDLSIQTTGIRSLRKTPENGDLSRARSTAPRTGLPWTRSTPTHKTKASSSNNTPSFGAPNNHLVLFRKVMFESG